MPADPLPPALQAAFQEGWLDRLTNAPNRGILLEESNLEVALAYELGYDSLTEILNQHDY